METDAPDPELDVEQIALAGQLTDDELEDIDIALLSFAHRRHFRKMARIVMTTMSKFPVRIEGLPDIFYAQRLRGLIERGLLVAEGDLKRMGHCEVKLPDYSVDPSAAR